MNKNLIERYVLHQLNEDELALFRGQLMFDEGLRKQVVETKMLIKSLQAVANAGAVPPKVTTQPVATTNSRQFMLRAAAVVVGVLLIGSMTYYWSSTNQTGNLDTPSEQVTTPPIAKPVEENPQPIAADEVEEDVNETSETTEPTQDKATLSPTPSNDNSTLNLDGDENEEERVFAQASPPKRTKIVDDSKVSMIDEDGIIAFAEQGYNTIDYLEDAINSATTKGKTTQVKVTKGDLYSLTRDKYGAIHLDLNGLIDTDKKSAKYIFKIYTNKSNEYEDNIPKYQEHLTVNQNEGDLSFDIDFKIDLPQGLYYYTIEELIEGEQDMIYANRIIVQNRK